MLRSSGGSLQRRPELLGQNVNPDTKYWYTRVLEYQYGGFQPMNGLMIVSSPARSHRAIPRPSSAPITLPVPE